MLYLDRLWSGCSQFPVILTFTAERISKQLSIDATKSPLTIDVADGLDGSGRYKVYNQVQTNVDFCSKVDYSVTVA